MRRLIGLGAAALALSLAAGAVAQTMTWEIRSHYPYQVQLEFYSQDRNHSWPGRGQAYDLDTDEFYTFDLSCQPGELVCYGAWETGTGDRWWGVGVDNRYDCSDCCAVCGEYVEPVTLVK